MWTRRKSSGTPEHTAPTDLFRALLCQMIEREIHGSWAHFELVAKGGWFQNLLRGNQPWIEVAVVDKATLELNPGLAKQKLSALPAFPEKWQTNRAGFRIVPSRDLDELILWMDRSFAGLSGDKSFTVTGWIEGL
jgi:hypothetical protein